MSQNISCLAQVFAQNSRSFVTGSTIAAEVQSTTSGSPMDTIGAAFAFGITGFAILAVLLMMLTFARDLSRNEPTLVVAAYWIMTSICGILCLGCFAGTILAICGKIS